MKFPMKSGVILAALAVLMSAPVVAQEQARPQNLPDAPSTAVAPATPPPPQPAAPAAQPKSAPEGAPTLEAPFAKKPAPSDANAPEPAQQAVATPKKTSPPPDEDKSLTTDDLGNPLETIKVPVNEVNVVFTVTDKHGRFVKNLTEKDFKVVDDNMVHVDRLRGLGLDLVLLVRPDLLLHLGAAGEQEGGAGEAGGQRGWRAHLQYLP